MFYFVLSSKDQIILFSILWHLLMLFSKSILLLLQATGYYADMGFQQAPTSLATGREAGLASVAYSMSDGRFARADNNASPVPSTLSQQNATQGHQQPMLNHTGLPPGYAYAFYGGSMIPAGTQFQYGTPTLYPVRSLFLFISYYI